MVRDSEEPGCIFDRREADDGQDAADGQDAERDESLPAAFVRRRRKKSKKDRPRIDPPPVTAARDPLAFGAALSYPVDARPKGDL